MKTSEKITVLIAEDHILIRESWSRMLSSSPGFEVVAECSSGEEAIEVAQKLRPALVLMDINLPGINGIETTRQILKLVPDLRVLGISFHAQPAYAFKMMKAGASGYITKNSPVNEMFLAITNIFDDKKYICNEVKNALLDNMITGNNEAAALNSLSKTESEIVGFIEKGLSSREIAEKLFIAIKTVERHRYNIFKKLKIKKVASLLSIIHKHQDYQVAGN